MSKRLIILDLDNTMIDTLHVWGSSLSCLIGNLDAELNIEVSISHDLIRRAHGQHRFNDGVSLVDWMLDPAQGLDIAGDWKKAVGDIQTEWLHQSAELSVPYAGMIGQLKNWRRAGCKIVIQTDAEDCAVLRRLWWIACHAVRSGDLLEPRDILDLVDKIYCQPSIPYSPRFLSDVADEFREGMKALTHIWQDKEFKPSVAHLHYILEEQGIEAERAIYVGDSHKDGAEARTLLIDFAWAQYGARVPSEILSLYAAVGSRNYSYGEQTVLDAMERMGINPALTLENISSLNLS